MKRKPLMLVITGIAVAIVIALAINTHMKLSVLEPEGHGDESPEEVLQEIVTGEPSHSENKANDQNIQTIEKRE